MAEGESKPRGWSEHEKMGLFIQLAVRAGKINWDEIDLPEGRTVKACQVMFDREKSKVKQATAGDGDGTSPAKTEKKATPAKRKAAAASDGNDAAPKKGKGGKGKKIKAEKEEVKSESGEEDAAGSPE